MTQLETLIQTLCPNGVHWSSVNDLIKQKIVHTVSASIKLKRNDYLTEGATPIISQEEEFISGYTNVTDKNITEREYVCFGDHSEHIKFVDFAFVQGADGLKIMYCNQDALSAKYFYYAVSNFYKKHCNYERHFKYLQELQIPLPPLAVQSEIVRVLDKFTLYKSELAAELAARLQQYEYYRDKLLTFDDTVKRVKLGEVFELRNGYTPSRNNHAFWDGGTIPWYRMEDIRKNGRILSDSIQHITPAAIKGKGLFKKDSFILATTATIGEHALLIADSLANQRFTNLQIRKSLKDSLLTKFVFYYMYVVDEFCKNHTNKSGFDSVDMKALVNMPFPLPPLSEQERIVSILDRFDKLCHDIREGLPAEIDLRQKQYEHYRDRLLTFEAAK